MAWGLADVTDNHRKALTIAQRINAHVISALTDNGPPVQYGVMVSVGLTFIAIRSDGVYAVLSDTDTRALLQALATRINYT